MANETSKDPAIPQPQLIPLAKIHDLPGARTSKQPDKSYGGLVTSIQASGVKEPVVLRVREDGEYQLVTGYRRRHACELAKKQDIPALVYEMSMQEALDYYRKVQTQPGMTIPGKPFQATAKGQSADVKEPEKPTPAATEDKAKGKDKSAQDAKAPAADGKDKTAAPQVQEQPAAPAAGDKAKDEGKSAQDAKAPVTDGKDKAAAPQAPEQPAAPAAGNKAKDEGKPVQDFKAPAADGKDKATAPQAPEQPAAPAGNKGKDKPDQDAKTPAVDEKDKGDVPKAPVDDFSDIDPAAVRANLTANGIVDGKVVDPDKLAAVSVVQQAEMDAKKGQPATPAADDKAKGENKPTQEPKPAAPEKSAAPAAGDKPKNESKPAQEPKATVTAAAVGPAAKGPAGTAISQVLPERLSAPDERAKKDFPAPKEGESIFVTLHPAYLVKSEYNTISVDPNSEDYQELKKSIELNGVKDPVLARIGDAGTLEIVSGQRRHMIATELNYPVPTIIQKISDADVKILVADGNLHRPKISTYDLSRSLRMKMEGMKQKSGRRKKGTFKAEELDSDVKLAQEMGMAVSKLNRLIRLSEATKDVCDRVDNGSLTLSVAYAVSFLTPKNQDEVLHLGDLGYKLPVERVEYMKKVEKAGKLNDETMRKVLDGVNVLDEPKETIPPEQPQPSTPASEPPVIPASPDVAPPPTPPQPEGAATAPQPAEGQEGPAPAAPTAPPASAPIEGQPQGKDEPIDGKQERPEYTKVVLAGDRLRKYFPDVMMTPREIEESIYSALEERRQREQKEKEKLTIFPKRGTKH